MTVSQPNLVVRRFLSFSLAYQLFSLLVGAVRFRRKLVTDILCVRPGNVVLDLGCGTADILDYLPDVNYVGIDISSRYINSAQKRFGARGQFIQGTPQDIQLHLQSDLAMGIGLLHHVDDQTAIEILEFAHRNMAKGARLVTVDPTIVPDQNPVAKWLAARDRGRNVRKPDDLVNLIRRVFPNVEASVHHDMLNIPYTHIVCTAVRS